MQREIKFRAWDKIEKRMLYRDIFDRNWYLTPKNYANGCNCVRGITPDDKPRIELMQFTGLKDKNGVEIYEGDIVNWSGWKIGFKHIDGTEVKQKPREVEFAQGCFRLKDDDCWNLSIWENIEVIGNIYEHSHLLAEAK